MQTENTIIKKDIAGYEGLYYVTSDGFVYSHDRFVSRVNRSNYSEIYDIKRKGKRLSSKKNIYGYVRCGLSKKGKYEFFSIHRLIAEAFLKKEKNQDQVNHKNGIKHDNHLENLEWVTAKENIKHAKDYGLINISGENHYYSKLKSSDVVEIKKLLKKGNTNVDISKVFNVTATCISSIKHNKSWKHIL
jgi:HNH endonuclease